MDILTFYLVIPLLTIAALFLNKDKKYVRLVSIAGMGLQVILSVLLIFLYISGHGPVNREEMMFTRDILWFRSLNIHYAVGVDWLSVAMLALTSVVVLSGILMAREVGFRTREFYLMYILSVTGANGFLISTDLFSMFFFLGILIVSMFFHFGIWGRGVKKSASLVLTILLMGGYAILLVGILGIYMNSVPDGNHRTFNITEISNYLIPGKAQLVFFPMVFGGFAILAGIFPFHIILPQNLNSSPAPVSVLYTGVLMKLGAYGILRVAIYLMPYAAAELSWLFMILAAITVIYGITVLIQKKGLKNKHAFISVIFSGLVLFAIMTLNKTAINVAVVLMIIHGIADVLIYHLINRKYDTV